MDAEMMEMMVSDWWDDDSYETRGLMLVGKPYYSEDCEAWVQDAEDDQHTYMLVDYNGEIRIEYMGTK